MRKISKAEKAIHEQLLKRILEATDAQELQDVFNKAIEIDFKDQTRCSHLIGLCVGRLFEYNPTRAKEILSDWMETALK